MRCKDIIKKYWCSMVKKVSLLKILNGFVGIYIVEGQHI